MKILKKSRVQAVAILMLILLQGRSYAQKIDTVSTFTMTAYIDAYYAYYTDSAAPGGFQKFPTVSPRSNTPSLNTAQMAMNYSGEKIRATMVLHFGDIPAAVWAPAPYDRLMEAHLGFKIYSKLWLDAGFFRGHFGTEFLLPSENITSSVSVGTFYEPVYESGVRLNFDPTRKLEINVFLLNGYNTFIENNNTKSLGMGITYALSDKVGLGYTNYIGDDSKPSDTIKHLRIHQNLFLNYHVKKFKLQVGGDFCVQQNSDIQTQSKEAHMFSGLATLKYQCTKKYAVYGRFEVFNDPDGIMSGVITDYNGNLTGYKLTGYTLGMEFKPTPESYIKLEGRDLQMQKDQYIFYDAGSAWNARYEVMINGGVTFDLLKNFVTRKND